MKERRGRGCRLCQSKVREGWLSLLVGAVVGWTRTRQTKFRAGTESGVPAGRIAIGQ